MQAGAFKTPQRHFVHRLQTPQVHNSVSGASLTKQRRSCCAGSRECIFCRIVQEAGTADTRVLYQDDLVVVIPDIKPAAALHLLVLPKAHIPNVSSLAGPDVRLVRHMAAVGEQVLQQQEQQQQQQQQQQLPQPAQHKFGFHKPPFRSVDHLHLHCFTLPHKWYRWVQYQSDLNWITADALIDTLTRMPSDQAPAAAATAVESAQVTSVSSARADSAVAHQQPLQQEMARPQQQQQQQQQQR